MPWQEVVSCRAFLATLLIGALTALFAHVLYKWWSAPFSWRNKTLRVCTGTGVFEVDMPARQLWDCPLLLRLAGLSIFISGWRLYITVESVDVWIAVGDTSHVTRRAKAKKAGSRLRRLAMWAAKSIVLFIGRRLVLSIGGVRARVTSRPSVGACPDRLYYLHARLGLVAFDWREEVRKLNVQQLIVEHECSVDETTTASTVAKVERIAIDIQDDGIALDLGTRIEFLVDVQLMMLLGSFADRSPKPQESDSLPEGTVDMHIPLPDCNVVMRPVGALAVDIVLPETDPLTYCFERVKLRVDRLWGALCVRDYVPFFRLHSRRISMSGVYLPVGKRNRATYCRADSLLGREGKPEAELFVVENLVLSDYGKADFGADPSVIGKWVEAVRQGRGPWWHTDLAGTGCEGGEDERQRLFELFSSPLGFAIDRDDSDALSLLPQQHGVVILASTDLIKLQVPSEYPLGNLFDHLVYLFKGPFLGDKWEMISTAGDDFMFRLCMKRAVFALEDDPFDLRVGSCFGYKAELLRSLKESDDPYKVYRKIVAAGEGRGPDSLMEVSGSDLIMQVQWKREWTGELRDYEGMVQLLSGIGREKELSAPMMRKLDTLMGGYVDVCASDLVFSLRSYALPLLSAPKLRMSGLAFMLELIPEPAATLTLPITVYADGLASNLHRAAAGKSKVLKNTNPLKIFHCVHASSTGPKLTHVGFSPHWLPTLQQVDRAVECFASSASDPSPLLPVWDKLRFLMRGCYSALVIRTPCQADILLSESALEERLTLLLPKGVSVSQAPEGRFVYDMSGGGVIAANSRQQLLLLAHHLSSKPGERLAVADKALHKAILPGNSVFLADLPSCRVTARVSLETADGGECADHFSVQVVTPGTCPSAGHDSFSKFRAASMSLEIVLEQPQADPSAPPGRQPIRLAHYRELEEWLIRAFASIVSLPCKKGRLWLSQFVPQHRPIDAARIVRDILLRVRLLAQPVSARGTTFHYALPAGSAKKGAASGVRVTAEGFNVAFTWRRHQGAYRTILGEWDVVDGRVSCFTTLDLGPSHEPSLAVSDITEGIRGYEVLEAPFISFTSVNETLVRADVGLADSHGDLRLLEQRIEQLDAFKRRFQEQAGSGEQVDEKALRAATIMGARVEFLEEAIRAVKDPKVPSTAKMIYTAYDPKLTYHASIRDTIYTIVNLQTVKEESKFARSRKMDLLIEEIVSFYSALPPAASTSKPGEQGAGTEGHLPDQKDIDDLFTKLLETKETLIAEPEKSVVAGDDRHDLDLRGPMELGDAYRVPMLTQFKLLNPRILLVAPSSGQADRHAVVLSMPVALVETARLYGPGGELEVERAWGSRTRFLLLNAQLSATDLGPAPAVRQVTEKISITAVYDKSLPAAPSARASGQLYSQEAGDSVRVHCPSFALRTLPVDFNAILGTISKLLVHRDPQLAERSAKKEEMLRTAIRERSEAVKAVANYVLKLKAECDSLEAGILKSLDAGEVDDKAMDAYEAWLQELSILAEAMLAMRSEQKKFSADKQQRFVLEVLLEEAAWSLLGDAESTVARVRLSRIHDEWLSDSDGSVGTVFTIGSVEAESAQPGPFQKIIEPLTNELLSRLGVATGPSAHCGSLVRFSFKAGRPKALGGQPSIEHAEIDISPLRIQVAQRTALTLFRFFFPKKQPVDEAAAAAAGDARPEAGERKAPPKQEDKIDFTSINIPASRHLVSFKYQPKEGAPAGGSMLDVTDFLLRLPDLEYKNERCTWADLALKIRGDALVIAARNAGSLIKQKILSRSSSQQSLKEKTRKKADPLREFYEAEPLPGLPDAAAADDDDSADSDRASVEEDRERRRLETVQKIDREERERKGRLLFGRYFSKPQ